LNSRGGLKEKTRISKGRKKKPPPERPLHLSTPAAEEGGTRRQKKNRPKKRKRRPSEKGNSILTSGKASPDGDAPFSSEEKRRVTLGERETADIPEKRKRDCGHGGKKCYSPGKKRLYDCVSEGTPPAEREDLDTWKGRRKGRGEITG